MAWKATVCTVPRSQSQPSLPYPVNPSNPVHRSTAKRLNPIVLGLFQWNSDFTVSRGIQRDTSPLWQVTLPEAVVDGSWSRRGRIPCSNSEMKNASGQKHAKIQYTFKLPSPIILDTTAWNWTFLPTLYERSQWQTSELDLRCAANALKSLLIGSKVFHS